MNEQRLLMGFAEGAIDDPGLVMGEDGVVEIVKPGGERVPLGGSQPVTRQHLHGTIPADQVVVSNGDAVALPWAAMDGDDLLDLTDPLAPTVITAGTYAFYVEIIADTAMTLGGYLFGSLIVDALGEAAQADALSVQASATVTKPRAIMVFTWYCPAGAQLQALAENDDGAASRTFRLSEAWIQRLS